MSGDRSAVAVIGSGIAGLQPPMCCSAAMT